MLERFDNLQLNKAYWQTLTGGELISNGGWFIYNIY